MERDGSGGGPATIDGEHGAVDERGFARAEIADHGGDIFGCAEAADGLALDELFTDLVFLVRVIFLEVAFDEGCLHGAGRDAIAADFFRIVDGDLAGERNHGALARAVSEALLDADEAGDGADVDDASLPAEHLREGGAGDQEDGADVDAHEAVEFVFSGVEQIADAADAGVF